MFKLIKLFNHEDERGNLVAIEAQKDIPFSVKRVYYIWGAGLNVVRGKHAHNNLQQLIICLSGSCDFYLEDETGERVITLNNPSEGLYLSGIVWREFTNLTRDCILLVLASEKYDPEDYIRDKKVFNQKNN